MLHCDYDAGAVGPFLSVLLDLLVSCFSSGFVFVFVFFLILLCISDNFTL